MDITLSRALTKTWDLIVIGGGPAGCQAAIFAAGAGLSVLLLEGNKIGGQIGQTPHIENLAGYEYGISGPSLAAMTTGQMHRLGVCLLKAKAEAVSEGVVVVSENNDRSLIHTKATVIATGFSWTKMDYQLPQDVTVHYGPATCLSVDVKDQEVIVVGGGNSAVQGILALASKARTVHVVCRSELKASDFLASRVRQASNIKVYEGARLTTRLGPHPTIVYDEKPCIPGQQCPSSRFFVTHTQHVFHCGESVPNTDWLGDSVELDADRCIITGNHSDRRNETCIPGVFAIGDVRSGSPRSVAAALGDAAICSGQIRNFLQDTRSNSSVSV